MKATIGVNMKVHVFDRGRGQHNLLTLAEYEGTCI